MTDGAVSHDVVSDGHGGLVQSDRLSHLAIGTMVSRDLDAARAFYEHYFGFECVRYASDRMLVRDRRAKYLMEQGARDFFVIDVRQVAAIDNPQKFLNHWGISISTPSEVDRLYAYTKANADSLYIHNLQPVRTMHGSYRFMLIDADQNWWEVEYRSGMTNDLFFSNGDFDHPTEDPEMKVDPKLALAEIPSEVLPPDSFLTHGTADLVDIPRTRAFYEEVLGLRCVRHVETATFTAGGGDFAIVGVEVGRHAKSQTLSNRWILLVDDDAELKAFRDRAVAAQERLAIEEIDEIRDSEDGGRSFPILSPDANWFEVSTRSRADLIALFARGDVA